MSYNPSEARKTSKRKRKITWFNPPFNLDVKTNIAAKFLRMITRHFPKGHQLHQIFNRHTLKVSYSTTRNIAKHISKHNNKVINTSNPEKEKKKCNCQRNKICPLRGECQEGPVVYQADVQTSTSTKKYIISTGRTFKERWNGHKHSLNNRDANSTALSSHVWALKDAGKEYKISWSI